MGLLDFLNTDEGRLGMGLLAAAGPTMAPMSFGQRLAGAMQGVREERAADEDRKLRTQLIGAQIGSYQSQEQARQFEQLLKLSEAQRAQAKRDALPGLLTTPAQRAVAANGGPTNAAAAAMETDTAGPGVDVQRALAAGYSPEEIEKLAGLQNLGRQEVARTVETTDAQGRPVTMQLDRFGRPVGQQMQQWKAPVTVNQGDRTSFIDPVSLTPRGQFAINMSPSERDASARGWSANAISQANLGLARQRLAFDERESGKPPSGWRWNADRTALEPIPGGPAAQPKEMTDAQSKAYLFGTRALESNRLLGQLSSQGVEQPGLIKRVAEAMPIVGAGAGTLTNWTQSAGQQQVEQAQRDFINAVLRRESGAVISDAEFDNARRQYFPQPGDSQQVIQQKGANRDLAIRGMLAEVPQSRRPDISAPAAPPAAAQPTAEPKPLPTNPKASSLEKGVVYQTKRGPLRWNGLAFEDL